MDTSVRYSNLVDTKTRVQLQLKDGVVFNNRYEGSAKAGAVKVRKSGAATVVDYDKTNGVALTEGTSQWITVEINKDKAVNEIIDGYNAAAVPDGLVADRLDEAGYGIALVLDTDGAKELVNGGTVLADTTALTKTNVYSKIVDMRVQMTNAGVPNDGQRYILVSPDVMGYVLKSPEFTPASNLGDVVKGTGIVGTIAGFNVIESANLGTITTGEGQQAVTSTVEFVAGHPAYATRVNEWAVPVHVQDLSGSGKYIGASAVQGRKVYAHKVTNANAILVKVTA
jgi:hypothetical protein